MFGPAWLIASLVVAPIEPPRVPTPRASDPAPADAALPNNLVVSGAVSLGAYQAGFLYYYMRWFTQASPTEGDSPMRAVSGASAGTLNGLLSAVTACTDPVDEAPEDSLFYTWIDVGMTGRRGLASGTPTARSFLSTAHLVDAIEAVRRRFATSTTWRPCDILFGAAVTHVDGRDLTLPEHEPEHGGGRRERTIARVQSDRFVFRIHGDGRSAPVIDTFAAPATELRAYYPVLGHTPAPTQVDFDDLAKVLLASSAVPGAFEPVALDYLVAREVHGVTQWHPQRDEFIDGGAFDNTPLHLAQKMSAWNRRGGDEDDERFLFVDPSVTTWRRPAEPQPDRSTRRASRIADREAAFQRGLLGTYGSFVSGVMRTSREAALVAAIERDPDLATHRIDSPARNLAVTSAHLIDMLGFFERDFRIFDFYLGMATARRYLEDRLPTQGAALQSMRGEVHRRSPRFACVDDFVDRVDADPQGRPEADLDAIPACAGLDRGEVVEVTGRTLATLDARQRESVADHNLLALTKVSAQMRRYLERQPQGTASGGETLDHLVGLLGDNGFQFVDLLADTRGWFGRLGRVDAEQARLLVRDVLERQLAGLAHAQPVGRRLVVRVMSQTALNFLAYRDPKYVLGVGAKRFSVEGTFGARLGRSRMRLDLQTRFGELLHTDFVRRRGGTSSGYTAEVSAVLRASVAVLRTPVVQLELATGPGVWEVFSWRAGHAIVRPGLELAATAVLLQRVYLEVAEQLFFDGCDESFGTERMHRWCAKTSPELTRDTKAHRFVLAAGVRFLPTSWRRRR